MGFVNMNVLTLGDKYKSDDLASLWGYKKGFVRAGVFTPKNQNIILLFVTKEKQSGVTQYSDELDGNLLLMSGQTKHKTDKRVYQNLKRKIDNIYLFYSEKHHTSYTYLGPCTLVYADLKTDSESEFVFLLESIGDEFDNEDNLVNYLLNTNASLETVRSVLEGSSRLTKHIRYERNPKNRRDAILAQGNKCKICGFDYDMFYGEDLAKGFIEVHHIVPISEGERKVDPTKDLIPVCANCHRMLHRKRKDNISIDELMARLNHN